MLMYRYPTGVKTTSRAYAKDEVVEIVDDPDKESITGLIPQLTKVFSQPSDDEAPYAVLQSLPLARALKVESFIAGSRLKTVECADKMIRSYVGKDPAVVESWRKWM
jgi:hypothetical protein